jgi:hypothetical protein
MHTVYAEHVQGVFDSFFITIRLNYLKKPKKENDYSSCQCQDVDMAEITEKSIDN